MAAPADKYLHVNVQDPANDGSVNVNVPLALAESILPAITIIPAASLRTTAPIRACLRMVRRILCGPPQPVAR
jgi:hypothetical protein